MKSTPFSDGPIRQIIEWHVVSFWAILLIVPLPWTLKLVVHRSGLDQGASVSLVTVTSLAALGLFLAYLRVFLRRWNRVLLIPHSWPSISLCIGGLSCFAMEMILQQGALVVIGWVLQAGAFLAAQRDKANISSSLIDLWPVVCIGVRLPESTELRIVDPIRLILARTTGYCFDFFAIPFRSDGDQFEFVRSQLSIEGCLAGTQPFPWLLVMTLIMFASLRRPTILLPIYVLAAITWTFGQYLLFLLLIGYIRVHSEVSLDSWRLILLSYLCLGAAFVMVLSTDRLLRVIFYPVPRDHVSASRWNPLETLWNRLFISFADIRKHK